MKIGITCYPTYGGSGVVATELGKELAKRGHEIHFISYALPFRLSNFVENIYFHEVELSTYPLFEFTLYSLALTNKMVEVAKYEELEVLHAHYAIPHASSAYLAKQILRDEGIDIKIVTTLHGTDITLVGLEPSFLDLVKFSIRHSDGVTAVSRYLREKTMTNYQIENDIAVIPNFVDTDLFKPSPPPELRQHLLCKGEKLMVHVSNFRPVKRVPDTIRILDLVNKEIPAKLVLVGDGPSRTECEQLVRDLKLKDRVLFLGKQDGLVDILNSADLFLIPSQSESFGLAALEAMACGVPVVSSSVGGLPEVVLHNQNGFIAEIGDVERMARYAVDLLKNKKKYKIFSQKSKEMAHETYGMSRIVPMYEEYYEKIVNGK